MSAQESAGTQQVLRFVDFPQVRELRHMHRSLARCTFEPGRLASVPPPQPPSKLRGGDQGAKETDEPSVSVGEGEQHPSPQLQRPGRRAGAWRGRPWCALPASPVAAPRAGRGARPAPPEGAAWHLAEGRACHTS